MKKSNGYLMKQLEDEWILLPVGEKTEAVHEVLSFSETAGFIYEHAEEAETIEQLALLVAKEYKVTPDEVYEDVKAVVQLLKAKEILL
mgnify:FL=1